MQMRTVPRRLTFVATIIGGLIGIVLSALNDWDFTLTFLVTLLLCMGLVALSAVVYTVVISQRDRS